MVEIRQPFGLSPYFTTCQFCTGPKSGSVTLKWEFYSSPMFPISVALLDTRSLGYPKLDPMNLLEVDDALAARFAAIANAVCQAWPKFKGGGLWKAMHGEMQGFFEIRISKGKTNYRFICHPIQRGEQLLIVVAGAAKPRQTGLPESFYEDVKTVFAKACRLENLPLQ